MAEKQSRINPAINKANKIVLINSFMLLSSFFFYSHSLKFNLIYIYYFASIITSALTKSSSSEIDT